MLKIHYFQMLHTGLKEKITDFQTFEHLWNKSLTVFRYKTSNQSPVCSKQSLDTVIAPHIERTSTSETVPKLFIDFKILLSNRGPQLEFNFSVSIVIEVLQKKSEAT